MPSHSLNNRGCSRLKSDSKSRFPGFNQQSAEVFFWFEIQELFLKIGTPNSSGNGRDYSGNRRDYSGNGRDSHWPDFACSCALSRQH